MTREAINELKKYAVGKKNAEKTEISVLALNRIIFALEEQEPKTVLYSGDGYADGYMVYDMAECPNCGYEYKDGDKDWKEPFCPHCGQALEWESEG